jgi:hypothetical protein
VTPRRPPSGALVVRARGPEARATPAEARLETLLERILGLESELRALSRSLHEFRRENAARLGPTIDELSALRRLITRLEGLDAELARWSSADRESDQHSSATAVRAFRRHRKSPIAAGRPSSKSAASGNGVLGPRLATSATSALAPTPTPLKELYRRLARRLHPDFARTDEERVVHGTLMSHVNLAYESDDRVRLELIAAELDAGLTPTEPTRETRSAHVEHRAASLEALAQSFERERERLAQTPDHRKWERATARAHAGGDYFAETLFDLKAERARLGSEAWGRILRLDDAVRALPRRSHAATTFAESSPWGRRASLTVRRSTRYEARALRDRILIAAKEAPWKVVLTLLAYFAELAGVPPAGLERAATFADRYAALARVLRRAPSFDAALGRMPDWLNWSFVSDERRVFFGLHLAHGVLLAGVRAALEDDAVRALGRAALELVGPEARCDACRRPVALVHLFRTRGIEDVHGLVCGRCAAVQQTYRIVGRAEGLEALNPYLLETGALVEEKVRIANATLRFQFLATERRTLSAGAVLGRFGELHLRGLELSGAEKGLYLVSDRVRLSPKNRVPDGTRLSFGFDRTAGVTSAEVLGLLRARARRRFASK